MMTAQLIHVCLAAVLSNPERRQQYDLALLDYLDVEVRMRLLLRPRPDHFAVRHARHLLQLV